MPNPVSEVLVIGGGRHAITFHTLFHTLVHTPLNLFSVPYPCCIPSERVLNIYGVSTPLRWHTATRMLRMAGYMYKLDTCVLLCLEENILLTCCLGLVQPDETDYRLHAGVPPWVDQQPTTHKLRQLRIYASKFQGISSWT